ncbi:hypothetical protein [Streptosporangium amethystogenes]|uniref:hypothetical protein n=1 Tax=Streptosporangium amethystogenes TaxID=2002 RepID=UPI0012FA3ECA|nr:hypothetical protein [Streptosporangium amethystogenes]
MAMPGRFWFLTAQQCESCPLPGFALRQIGIFTDARIGAAHIVPVAATILLLQAKRHRVVRPAHVLMILRLGGIVQDTKTWGFEAAETLLSPDIKKPRAVIDSGRLCCSVAVVRGGVEPPTFRFSGVAIALLALDGLGVEGA